MLGWGREEAKKKKMTVKCVYVVLGANHRAFKGRNTCRKNIYCFLKRVILRLIFDHKNVKRKWVIE